MFKKAFASMGIGSASVDLEILTEQLVPGYPFIVQISIRGGSIAQEIKDISLHLMTSSSFEYESSNGGEHEASEHQVIARWDIDVNRMIGAGEEFTEQYELILHPETPVTEIPNVVNYTNVWIHTGMDIKGAVDASDRDYLAVYPTPTQAAVINAMFELGYGLAKIDVESGNIRHPDIQSDVNCYQEFEFKPVSDFHSRINEIEISFVNNGEYTGVIFEIDKKYSRDLFRHLMIHNDVEDEHVLIPEIEGILSSF